MINLQEKQSPAQEQSKSNDRSQLDEDEEIARALMASMTLMDSPNNSQMSLREFNLALYEEEESPKQQPGKSNDSAQIDEDEDFARALVASMKSKDTQEDTQRSNLSLRGLDLSFQQADAKAKAMQRQRRR